MKKLVEKVLAAVLAAVLLLSAFGCASEQESSSQSSGSGDSELSVSEEPQDAGERTLHIAVGRGAEVEDYDNNEYIKWLEAETGIEIQWDQITAATLKDKLPVMMMSGTLPDVFMNCDLTAAQQTQYGVNEKLLIPLNGLIDSMGKEVKRLFEEQQGVEDLIKMGDGQIYSLPTYSDIIHVNYSQRAIINQEFLTALGMDMPETIDEFYEYLKAVKEKDPNGNGLQDEIPLIASPKGWKTDLFGFMTQPFIFSDGIQWVDVDENGKVFSILDKEEYRDALRWMNKLYSEGLIYEGSLTMESDQYKIIGENPDALILGAAIGTGNKSVTDLGSERYAKFTSLPPLEGPAGVKQTPWYRYVNVRQGKYSITKDCSNPELAFELADFMLSYESSMRLRLGVKGVDWDDAAEGETTVDGRPAVWKRITPYTGEPQSQHLGNDGLFYETRGMFLNDSVFDHTKDLMSPENDQFLLAEYAEKYYEPYGKEVIPPVVIPSEENDEYVSLEVQLKQYYEEARASFVSGAWSVENDWDRYVSDLQGYGLERYIEILQKAYDDSPIKIGA